MPEIKVKGPDQPGAILNRRRHFTAIDLSHKFLRMSERDFETRKYLTNLYIKTIESYFGVEFEGDINQLVQKHPYLKPIFYIKYNRKSGPTLEYTENKETVKKLIEISVASAYAETRKFSFMHYSEEPITRVNRVQELPEDRENVSLIASGFEDSLDSAF